MKNRKVKENKTSIKWLNKEHTKGKLILSDTVLKMLSRK